MALLEVKDLKVSFFTAAGEVKAVEKMVAFPYHDGGRYYNY